MLKDAASVKFVVLGHAPVPRGRGSITLAEKAWRTAVAEAATEQIGPIEQALVAGWPWLAVALDFHFASMTTDVDNMPKPILDTLFSPGPANPNRLHLGDITGVVFPLRDDSAVRELCLTKDLVGEELLGVSITIMESAERT